MPVAGGASSLIDGRVAVRMARMSVYQYYEFQALDRRLAKADMEELRK